MALITYDDKTVLNQNASIPATQKISASDMNQIKTGINTNETNIAAVANSVPDVLYNSSGSNGTIALSDSAANYSYIEILFRDNNNGYNSVKVADPNGKYAVLSVLWAGGYTSTYQALYIDVRTVLISGTSISTYDNRYYKQALKYNGTVQEYGHTNNIYIEKVLGYK